MEGEAESGDQQEGVAGCQIQLGLLLRISKADRLGDVAGGIRARSRSVQRKCECGAGRDGLARTLRYRAKTPENSAQVMGCLR